MIDKNNAEQAWISIILRVAIGLMFAWAGLSKFMMGLDNFGGMVMGMFKDTFLPGPLLRLYINVLPFAELLAGLWVLSGIKLRAAWVTVGFLLISLAFGLLVAKQNAADIYVFLLVVCVGLYMSKYDCCHVGGCCGKKNLER
jgi:uncharacterized membrane protein YphA (DoxX/SURF4 family)